MKFVHPCTRELTAAEHGWEHDNTTSCYCLFPEIPVIPVARVTRQLHYCIPEHVETAMIEH